MCDIIRSVCKLRRKQPSKSEPANSGSESSLDENALPSAASIFKPRFTRALMANRFGGEGAVHEASR